MMGTMSMYYVTDPDGTVANIQSLLDMTQKESPKENITTQNPLPKNTTNNNPTTSTTPRHTLDTREKVREVLR